MIQGLLVGGEAGKARQVQQGIDGQLPRFDPLGPSAMDRDLSIRVYPGMIRTIQFRDQIRASGIPYPPDKFFTAYRNIPGQVPGDFQLLFRNLPYFIHPELLCFPEDGYIIVLR